MSRAEVRHLRILQVVTDRDRRGAQVFATDLGTALAARGHEVTTVALAPGTAGDSLPVDVLGPHRRSVRSLRALRERSAAVDVVVAHGSTTLPACALALAGNRPPFVYRQISDSRFWAPTRARRARVRWGLSRAAAVVALWGGSADVLTTDFGVLRGRIVVIPNGVPTSRFVPATAVQRLEARRSFGLPPEGHVALAMSALVPEKGVDVAIEAAARAGAALLVVGDGPERAALEAKAAAGAATVHFTGSIHDPLPAFHAADVIVFPTRGGDSMPAALIEAGLCGLPAVTTAIGAIPEVVAHDVTGIVAAEPSDVPAALLRLLVAPDLAAAYGAAARARCAARFGIDTVAEAWESVLVNVATTGRPR